MLDTAFFYLFALFVLGGAILTVTFRNAIHCALALIGSLIGVAGLYLLQKAEFLFAVQIILYIGGVMLLFLFVIMLVNLEESAKERQFGGHWWLAVACVAGVALQVVYFLKRDPATFRLADPTAAAESAGGNVEQIADVLFSQYLVPFEVASILLLAAVVGSVVMAKKRI